MRDTKVISWRKGYLDWEHSKKEGWTDVKEHNYNQASACEPFHSLMANHFPCFHTLLYLLRLCLYTSNRWRILHIDVSLSQCCKCTLFSLLEVNTYNSKMVASITILDLNMLSSFWCQLMHTRLHFLISSQSTDMHMQERRVHCFLPMNLAWQARVPTPDTLFNKKVSALDPYRPRPT